MQRLQEWLTDFFRGKTEATSHTLSDQFAIYSIRRFLEGSDKVWEIAFTYTERPAVRSGQIAEDGLNVLWSQWTTEHDVDVSKRKP
ncbi:MAG TPA: hypothetical protein VE954_12800 [Oligoflexus sp.]|uniref:hypothetical protein n=1 Tax=Oligoflexus sp. TaxID=1971216 RepID=UPI002D287CC7|nr:hypothetical protein [Oligoflexus sp.]HYX33987.1 hypothetical protein [Oligoflexus sp.]